MSIAHSIATYIMYLNQHVHSSGHNFATKEMSLTSPMNTASLTEYSQMLKSLSEELEFQRQQMRQSYELKLRTMERKLKERKQKLLERMSKSKLQPVSLLSDVMHDSANSTSTVITINASDVVRSTCISTTVLERKQLDAQQSVLSPAKHTTCTIDTECTGTLGSSTDHGSSIQGSQISGVQTDKTLTDIKTSTLMTETDVLEFIDRHEYDEENDVKPSYVETLANACVYLKNNDSQLHGKKVSGLSPPCYHPQLIVDPIMHTSDLPVSDNVTTHADATEPDMTLGPTLSADADLSFSPEMYTSDHGSSLEGYQASDAQTGMPLNDNKISTSMTETDVFEVTDRHEYGDMNDVMPSSCVKILDNTYVYLKGHDSPLHVNEMSELSPPCYHQQIPQLRVDSIIPTSDLPVIDSVTIHVDATEPDVPISSTVSAAIDVPSSPEMYTFELFTPAFPRHLNYCMIVDQHAYFTLVPADNTIPSRMWLHCRILKILHSGELTTLIIRNPQLIWRSLQLLPDYYFDADYER